MSSLSRRGSLLTPLPFFLRGEKKPGSVRRGVSELYASLLMIGVTLAFGGVVAAAALTQYALATSQASLGSSLQESSAGKQVSLVYVTVGSPGTCPSYNGEAEGTSITVALFNYGSAQFAPTEFVVNSTIYAGTFGALAPGSLAAYALTPIPCAHSSGQTILVVDAYGEVFQFAT